MLFDDDIQPKVCALCDRSFLIPNQDSSKLLLTPEAVAKIVEVIQNADQTNTPHILPSR